ncbi:MAG TPA: YcgN family cysteine cluster protein [Marinospirillum sp.]|uniref:YcgN family cysteine cluster protein n=1 Tax=Marinospirillum sp. TaxID=2183934 RepID=UPI002B49B268|nr:YcgN family cysteine cluster protein [Marinospirillum sp.]HKM14391.1 YcgN family cysteine cluster protein [Marinospirillum sp.]
MADKVRSNLRSKFWELPLVELNAFEWDALCDGCGRCCLHKLQDEESEELYYTDVACKLLDLKTCRCKHYEDRIKYVPDCMSIRDEGKAVYALLPSTCAYRLRYESKPLPLWHPLFTGNTDAMHNLEISIQGKAISEDAFKGKDLEERIIHWID